MHICFVCSEVFGWGRYGGFGKLVLDMGMALAKRGIEVSAIVWRGHKQRPVEYIDGITIYSYPRNYKGGSSLSHILSYLKSLSIYRHTQAHIYHSIEATYETYFAQSMMPQAKHIVHFQDPYDETAYQEMQLVDEDYRWDLKRKIQFYTDIAVLGRACRRAHALFTQARFFIPRVRRLYKVDGIHFLPNPIQVPKASVRKAPEPTVCFLGRWDPQKRVHLFLEMSKKFPQVKFIAMGKSTDPEVDYRLKRRYCGLPNLELRGFVPEEEKRRILAKSWILINTSIREGLPVSFLEACAYKTAILSYVNPDRFASHFGYWAQNLDFAAGLNYLLKHDRWKRRAEEGYHYVKDTHDEKKVIDDYVEIYESLL